MKKSVTGEKSFTPFYCNEKIKKLKRILVVKIRFYNDKHFRDGKTL